MPRPIYILTDRRGEQVFAWLLNMQVSKVPGGFEGQLHFKALATGKLLTEYIPIPEPDSVKVVLDKWLDAHLAVEALPF